jgi:hypothetical protein
MIEKKPCIDVESIFTCKMNHLKKKSSVMALAFCGKF